MVGDGGYRGTYVSNVNKKRREEREKKGKENSYQSLEFTFWEKLAAE